MTRRFLRPVPPLSSLRVPFRFAGSSNFTSNCSPQPARSQTPPRTGGGGEPGRRVCTERDNGCWPCPRSNPPAQAAVNACKHGSQYWGPRQRGGGLPLAAQHSLAGPRCPGPAPNPGGHSAPRWPAAEGLSIDAGDLSAHAADADSPGRRRRARARGPARHVGTPSGLAHARRPVRLEARTGLGVAFPGLIGSCPGWASGFGGPKSLCSRFTGADGRAPILRADC